MILPTVRVRREGGRGHHLINKSAYDANPTAHVLVDESGEPIEATKTDDQGYDLATRTVAELRDLAADRGIDLGDATKKADIIAAIEATKTAD